MQGLSVEVKIGGVQAVDVAWRQLAFPLALPGKMHLWYHDTKTLSAGAGTLLCHDMLETRSEMMVGP